MMAMEPSEKRETPKLLRAPTRTIRTWHMDSLRWNDFVPRTDDIIIATYPKCGTTWMQQIVSLLIFQSADARPVTAMSPWIDARFTIPLADMLRLIDAQTHRRFLKTHLPADAFPIYQNTKMIHVARDGLDACMSWHNHSLRYKRLNLLDDVGLADKSIGRLYPRPAESARQFFLDWMGQSGPERQTDVSVETYFDTHRSYWNCRHDPNLLSVHYNDLKNDLDGEMRRIAKFLEIETPHALWPQLVQAATFAAMQREGAALMPTAVNSWNGGHAGFIFSGENERWRAELGADDIELYRAEAARELEPELNAWLRRGRSL